MVERSLSMREVPGSTPGFSTLLQLSILATFFDIYALENMKIKTKNISHRMQIYELFEMI